MTYVALLLDNLLGDLLLEELRQLFGDCLLTVFERSLQGLSRAASCATEA
jgi:hypothetical protein